MQSSTIRATQPINNLTSRSTALIVVGNVIEWYDFAVYGYAVDSVARNFFPGSNHAAGVLQAFGVFALGFIGRLVGGALCGTLGDRVGRVFALRLSLMLMAFSTAAIAMLPTYSSIGLWAPVLLTVLRLLQGMSVGGEYTTSLTVIIETSAEKTVGYASGLVGGASVVGFVFGSAVGAAVESVLSPSDMTAWGWRIPFAIGSLVAVVAWKLRSSLPEYTDPEAIRRADAGHPAERDTSLLLRTVAGTALYMVGFYIPFVYIATPLGKGGSWQFTAALLALSLASPLAGVMADRFGIRRTLLLSGSIFACASPLLLLLVSRDSYFFAGLMAFVLLFAPVLAVANTPLVLQFPARKRTTGFSIGFNAAAVLFGGSSPFLAELAVQQTGSLVAASLLIIAAAPLSLWAWWRKEAKPPGGTNWSRSPP